MAKKSVQNDLEKLDEIFDLVAEKVEEYNLLAKKLKLGSRLAYASTEVEPPYWYHCTDYHSDESRRKYELYSNYEDLLLPKEFVKKVFNSDEEAEAAAEKLNSECDFDLDDYASNDHYCGASVAAPGAEGWFPSSIC